MPLVRAELRQVDGSRHWLLSAAAAAELTTAVPAGTRTALASASKSLHKGTTPADIADLHCLAADARIAELRELERAVSAAETNPGTEYALYQAWAATADAERQLWESVIGAALQREDVHHDVTLRLELAARKARARLYASIADAASDPAPAMVPMSAPTHDPVSHTLAVLGIDSQTAAAVARRREKLSAEQKGTLHAWLMRHAQNPYPTEDEKAQLAAAIGSSSERVTNWFINARSRHLRRRRARSAADPDDGDSD